MIDISLDKESINMCIDLKCTEISVDAGIGRFAVTRAWRELISIPDTAITTGRMTVRCPAYVRPAGTGADNVRPNIETEVPIRQIVKEISVY